MNMRELGFVMLAGGPAAAVAAFSGWFGLTPGMFPLLVGLLYVGWYIHNEYGGRYAATLGAALAAIGVLVAMGGGTAILPFALVWAAPPALLQIRARIFKG